MIAVKKVDLFPPRHLFSLQKKPKKGAKRKGDLLNSQKATSCVTFPRKGEEDLFTLDRTLRIMFQLFQEVISEFRKLSRSEHG